RHHCLPRVRRSARLTVDGDRRRPCAIPRIDWPAAMPREISSRSSSLSAANALRRGAGAIPPWSTTIRSTPVLFLRSSAREIAAALCPFLQRSHNSAFCSAVNLIRDVTILHLLSRKIRRCCPDLLNPPADCRRSARDAGHLIATFLI